MALLLLLGVAHLASERAGAQAPSTADPASVSYRYGLGKGGEILPTNGNKIQEVIPLGKDNAFLIAYNESIVAYRTVNEGGRVGIRRLGEIELPGGYVKVKDIIVLDDQASFLVHTSAGVAVWAVTKTEIVAESD